MQNLTPKLIDLTSDTRYRRLLENSKDTVNLKSGLVMLGLGESVGEHITQNKEEIIIILEGEAEIFCEGSEPLKALANSLVYMPPEKKHDVKNTGNGILRYVYITAKID